MHLFEEDKHSFNQGVHCIYDILPLFEFELLNNFKPQDYIQ